MADSSRTIMTDAGFALETRVRADETKMQFTRATISTDDHFSDTDDALAKLTELSNIQQDGKVTAVQVINTTTVYVQVDVNQAESKADYQMRSAALYAKDDDGTEVLYGVTVLQDPVFVHKDADGSYLGFGINTTVGRASNVVVVVDPANMVTQQVFESTMKNYYTKAEVDAKFVTDDDFASKLPKNIATTDAANTFDKSQTLAGGATDGKGNAYATTKDVATGLKNGLITKVTDNKDNTITANNLIYDLSKTGITPLGVYKSGSFNDLPLGTVFTDPPMTDGPDTIHSFTTTTFLSSEWGGRKAQIAITDNTNLMYFRVGTGTDTSWSSWTLLSDDSKVVHSADMRKPASEVVGLEDITTAYNHGGIADGTDAQSITQEGLYLISGISLINFIGSGKWWGTLQVIRERGDVFQIVRVADGSIYTNSCAGSPASWSGWHKLADDSKVVHTTDTSNWQKQKITNDDGSIIKRLTISNGDDLNKYLGNLVGGYTTFYVQGGVTNNPSTQSARGFILKESAGNGGANYGMGYLVDNIGNVWSIVVTASTTPTYTLLSNDSKVAHLSGANNFDTVPTVNNNPLLLASSLPSDLARTGQDANFTAKLQQNGQDVALANNTIARNPDTGVVSEPTDFTKLTVNGGKSVATSDDLKSLEASAWRPLTLENANNGAILFKDNGDGTASLTGSANFVIAAASGVITEAIDPPSGYQFSSLAWNKGTDGDGIFAIGGRSGTSAGPVYTPTALIQNGKICFKGGSYSYPELMFSPCLNTTDKTSSSCEPAIVGITKI